MRYSVYIATSPIGKQYVGKTNNFQVRVRNHNSEARQGKGFVLHAAIRKYGCLEFKEVFVAFDEAAAFSLEKQLIKELNTKIPHGYNLTDGGEGISNPGPETRAKIAKAHKHKKLSEKTKLLLKKANLGKKHSATTCAKMSVSRKGKKNPMFGKPKPANAGVAPKRIRCIDTGDIFESISAVARDLGVRPGSLSDCLNGRQQTCCGYRWEFA